MAPTAGSCPPPRLLCRREPAHRRRPPTPPRVRKLPFPVADPAGASSVHRAGRRPECEVRRVSGPGEAPLGSRRGAAPLAVGASPRASSPAPAGSAPARRRHAREGQGARERGGDRAGWGYCRALPASERCLARRWLSRVGWRGNRYAEPIGFYFFEFLQTFT